MKKNYVIILCIILAVGTFSNISLGNKMGKSDDPDNFLIEIIQSDKAVPSDYVNAYPIVEILYPQDGANLPTNYLEVLGYAMDPDGMKYMEWTYQYGSYINHNNETFNLAQYVNFRIQVFNLQPGTHTVTVTFYDIYNNTGSDSVTVYYGQNHPPEKPSLPQGLNLCSVGIEYTYSTYSTDADNDKIKYGWDWNGDNNVEEWTDFYLSGETIKLTHIWSLPGTYNVKVMAEDEKGAKSDFSQPLAVVITDNHPPDQPEKPTGNANGRTGVSYSYSSNAIDSDNDRIYYMFDWDDGTNSGWIGSYNSGDAVSASHIWNNKGTFSIKVKAKDEHGAESTWSESLTVSMPKTKTFSFNLFERMPILKQIFSLFFKNKF